MEVSGADTSETFKVLKLADLTHFRDQLVTIFKLLGKVGVREAFAC